MHTTELLLARYCSGGGYAVMDHDDVKSHIEDSICSGSYSVNVDASAGSGYFRGEDTHG
jgi:hypothetical protein